MRNLLWKDYVNALGADDTMVYYTEKYGNIESASIVVDYHMNKKKLDGIGHMFSLVDEIENMVFGQFIMAERALTGGLKKADAIYSLALAVIRPLGDKVFDNTDKEKELLNTKSIMEYDAAEILNEIETYVKKRDEFINNKYSGVFYVIATPDEHDESEYEEEDEEEETQEEIFASQWYWYAIARSLADDGIVFKRIDGMSNLECVMMTEMSYVAPDIAYMRQKQIIEDANKRRASELNNIR